MTLGQEVAVAIRDHVGAVQRVFGNLSTPLFTAGRFGRRNRERRTDRSSEPVPVAMHPERVVDGLTHLTAGEKGSGFQVGAEECICDASQSEMALGEIAHGDHRPALAGAVLIPARASEIMI